MGHRTSFRPDRVRTARKEEIAMPVGRRGPLLAGCAALLGLWAGAGCHSLPGKQDSPPPKAVADSPTHSWFGLRHASPDYKVKQVSATAPKDGPSLPQPPRKPDPDPVEETGPSARPSPSVAMGRPIAVRSTRRPYPNRRRLTPGRPRRRRRRPRNPGHRRRARSSPPARPRTVRPASRPALRKKSLLSRKPRRTPP